MDFQAKAAIVFLVLLALILYIKREKLHKQNLVSSVIYVLMYRTKVGLKFMDSMARRHPRTLHYLSMFGIFIGFAGMALISVLLLKGTYDLFFVEQANPAIGLVQPFSKDVPGTFFVPFFYLIISIFVIVIIHEFSHGIIARLHNIRIKSSGLAFFGIILPLIPAAFVEPDEKMMAKRPRKQQLSILAAGPFANILIAFIIFGIAAIAAKPLVDSVIDYDGVLITDLTKDEGIVYPSEAAGMAKGEVIRFIGSAPIITTQNLSDQLDSKAPGSTITITTNVSSYNLTLGENPDNRSLPYMGLYLMQNTKIKESFIERYGRMSADALIWALGLLVWLYALNLGIGLFNLLPLPITDGGRMLQLGLERFFEKDKAFRIWKFFAMLFIVIIIVNLGAGFLK